MTDLTAVTAYHSARQNSAWLASDVAVQDAAILRATDYIEENFRLRDDVAEDDPRLVRAVAELALTALTASLVETAEAQLIREKIDGVIEKQWAEGPVADRFPTISRLLSPLLVTRPSNGFRSVKVTL
jgi:hypothetical protein